MYKITVKTIRGKILGECYANHLLTAKLIALRNHLKYRMGDIYVGHHNDLLIEYLFKIEKRKRNV